jgi:hypothetical protein
VLVSIFPELPTTAYIVPLLPPLAFRKGPVPSGSPEELSLMIRERLAVNQVVWVDWVVLVPEEYAVLEFHEWLRSRLKSTVSD